MSSIRQDLSKARERIASLEDRLGSPATAGTGAASAPSPYYGGLATSGTATGGVGSSTPGGSVAGDSAPASTSQSEALDRLRRELNALQERVDRLERQQPAVR